MTTLIEQKSEKDIKQKRNNHTDEEIEIDLMDIYNKLTFVDSKDIDIKRENAIQ